MDLTWNFHIRPWICELTYQEEVLPDQHYGCQGQLCSHRNSGLKHEFEGNISQADTILLRQNFQGDTSEEESLGVQSMLFLGQGKVAHVDTALRDRAVYWCPSREQGGGSGDISASFPGVTLMTSLLLLSPSPTLHTLQ